MSKIGKKASFTYACHRQVVSVLNQWNSNRRNLPSYSLQIYHIRFLCYFTRFTGNQFPHPRQPQSPRRFVLFGCLYFQPSDFFEVCLRSNGMSFGVSIMTLNIFFFLVKQLQPKTHDLEVPGLSHVAAY